MSNTSDSEEIKTLQECWDCEGKFYTKYIRGGEEDLAACPYCGIAWHISNIPEILRVNAKKLEEYLNDLEQNALERKWL